MGIGEVREQLDRVLRSEDFIRAGRLTQLLAHLVQQSLDQPGNGPSEYELAQAVFGRDNFDPSIDSIVRVQTNRLRSKLEKYYHTSGQEDPLVLEIPKGGYSVTIRARPALAPTNGHARVEVVGQESWRRSWLVPGSFAALAVSVLGLWLTFRRTVPEMAVEPVPLTSQPGWEAQPSFSPDGSHLAFVWKNEQYDNNDIYVQALAGAPVRRTTDPAPDLGPAWSPDGRWIAFFREGRVFVEVRLMAAVGDAEQTIGTIDGPTVAEWTPDSRWLVVSHRPSPKTPYSLVLLSLQGEKIELTTPPEGTVGDRYPALSPDGGRLAFVRDNSILIAPLTAAFRVAGTPRQVPTGDAKDIRAVRWTPDGRELVFCALGSVPDHALWRVAVDRTSSPRRLAYAGSAGRSLAFSRSAATGAVRLAYTRETVDYDIWRINTGPVGTAETPRRLINSTRIDTSAEYSPDGKRIAFASTRKGSYAIWVSDADGQNPTQLTSIYGSSPTWSPDGERIAFDSMEAGQWEVYVINQNGAGMRRITYDPRYDAMPSWSRDGKSIYFVSSRTGENQVWKVPVDGEKPRQITKGGGAWAQESADGKLLYYMKEVADCAPLWSVPVDGGEERPVLQSVCWRGYVPATDGIWAISSFAGQGFSQIQFFGFASPVPKPIAKLKGSLGNRLSVSPDARSLLYSVAERRGDIMLIDNFR